MFQYAFDDARLTDGFSSEPSAPDWKQNGSICESSMGRPNMTDPMNRGPWNDFRNITVQTIAAWLLK